MSKVLYRMDELDRYGLDTYQRIQVIQAEQLERIADALVKQNAGNQMVIDGKKITDLVCRHRHGECKVTCDGCGAEITKEDTIMIDGKRFDVCGSCRAEFELSTKLLIKAKEQHQANAAL